FALGVLDPDEQRDVEQHLATGCDVCQRELASWREVVGLVPLATQDVEVPDLKPVLLQRLGTSAAGAQVIPLRRRPRWPIITVPLAAAAVALLAFGIIRDSLMRGEVHRQQELVTSLRSELDSAHAMMQRLTEQLAAKEKDSAALRAALAAAEESLTI